MYVTRNKVNTGSSKAETNGGNKHEQIVKFKIKLFKQNTIHHVNQSYSFIYLNFDIVTQDHR